MHVTSSYTPSSLPPVDPERKIKNLTAVKENNLAIYTKESPLKKLVRRIVEFCIHLFAPEKTLAALVSKSDPSKKMQDVVKEKYPYLHSYVQMDAAKAYLKNLAKGADKESYPEWVESMQEELIEQFPALEGNFTFEFISEQAGKTKESYEIFALAKRILDGTIDQEIESVIKKPKMQTQEKIEKLLSAFTYFDPEPEIAAKPLVRSIAQLIKLPRLGKVVEEKFQEFLKNCSPEYKEAVDQAFEVQEIEQLVLKKAEEKLLGRYLAANPEERSFLIATLHSLEENKYVKKMEALEETGINSPQEAKEIIERNFLLGKEIDPNVVKFARNMPGFEKEFEAYKALRKYTRLDLSTAESAAGFAALIKREGISHYHQILILASKGNLDRLLPHLEFDPRKGIASLKRLHQLKELSTFKESVFTSDSVKRDLFAFPLSVDEKSCRDDYPRSPAIFINGDYYYCPDFETLYPLIESKWGSLAAKMITQGIFSTSMTLIQQELESRVTVGTVVPSGNEFMTYAIEEVKGELQVSAKVSFAIRDIQDMEADPLFYIPVQQMVRIPLSEVKAGKWKKGSASIALTKVKKGPDSYKLLNIRAITNDNAPYLLERYEQLGDEEGKKGLIYYLAVNLKNQEPERREQFLNALPPESELYQTILPLIN